MLKLNGEQQDNKNRLLWEELISNSKKIISFYDMGGQSKFSVSVYYLTKIAFSHL